MKAAIQKFISRGMVWLHLPLFLFKKALLIFVTIFAGIFITIILINRPVTIGIQTKAPQLDTSLKRQINVTLDFFRRDTPGFNGLPEQEQEEKLAELRARLEADTGINLPYLPRHLYWTYNALRFNWGEMKQIGIGTPPMLWFGRESSVSINEIIAKHLPNTMLLAATANLLIFLLGLPLAMWLAGRYGSWLDRLFTLLAPVFSIPSWVIGIFMIAIFAAWLKILPFGGMLDTLPPEEPSGYLLIVAKHMVLPVLSIFLSLFFQLLFTWRTFFLIYSEEDYVVLGKAVGLPERRLNNDYVLRPSLSFVITSFSMILVTFWQMIMALEVIFSWPGVGWLFINVGLPNFWGESMYPGEMVIALTLIVVFAYMLGMIVFILDLAYALVDPRVHMVTGEPVLRQKRNRGRVPARLTLFKPRERRKLVQPVKTQFHIDPVKAVDQLRSLPAGIMAALAKAGRIILNYPSAIFGLVIIMLLVAGSVYAMAAMPYRKVGAEWLGSTMVGSRTVPKLALPEWVNIFRRNDLLSTIILDSSKNQADVSGVSWNGSSAAKTLTFTFDYTHEDFPTEVYLYLDGNYSIKKSFVAPVWITPDGREFQLKGTSVGTGTTYDFSQYIHPDRIVDQDTAWQKWFTYGQIFPTPVHYVLFAQPGVDQAKVLKGQYTLRLNGLMFEEAGDIQARLVILGSVYGLAGTDNYRRDLSTPLLWGMPIALGFGLLGALLTTLLSMVVAASGVWFGGWADDLIQRLTEVNMILPVLAISVLAYAYLNVNLWIILLIIVLMNVFSSPTKNFRSAFLSVKQAGYIEAAQAYGAGSLRIILRYMVPRILPTVIPQLIVLIPAFVFLEVTLGLFNINTGYPTWGTIIYQGIRNGALYYGQHRLLEPLALVMLTGMSFSLFGFTLERILNPRLLKY